MNKQAAPAPGERPLPSGTVTFLFTDIQGSTPLWEKMPAEMEKAVALHHALLREAIEANGGQVTQVIGDSFESAFRLAQDGLCAAIAAQRALQSAQWGATGPIQVRMGLHTGPAELDPLGNAPYAVSHTLNRAARIMSVGSGGQILLSQETKDLCERNLPEGVSLRGLGEHHLKGMSTPEHLYQVVAVGLQIDFPAMTTSVRHPHNLPNELTSFIGREEEIGSLQEKLTTSGTRLLTLTGSGGTGKTRLALQVSGRVLDDFPDGVWLVELAPLGDPALVAATAALVLGLREVPGVPVLESLTGYLKNRCLLLILDNCEHILPACASLAGHLLKNCPKLRILATSREILNVPGEAAYRVPSLPVPDPRQMPLFEEAARVEAVHLFVERASQSAPGFMLDESNIKAVATICARLDGIPLAIELAAARVRVLPVAQITARLDNLFRLLMGGSSTVMPRQQTLKAAIDWSYNLLTPRERLVMQSLSVFSGGWTLEAAEYVCVSPGLSSPLAASAAEAVGAGSEIEMWEVLDLLSSLVDKSLVIFTTTEGGEGRYRMLDTIRQYSRDLLVASGQGGAVRDWHMRYYLELAERMDERIRGPEQMRCLDLLEVELENLRLALEWSLVGHAVEGLRLVSALKWFWDITSKQNEARHWLERLFAAEAQERGNQPLSVPHQSTEYRLTWSRSVYTGYLVDYRGSYSEEQWLSLLEENVGLCRRMGENAQRELCRLLQALGINLFYTYFDRSHLPLFEESLEIARKNGYAFEEAQALFHIGDSFFWLGDMQKAQPYLEQSLAAFQAIKDTEGTAACLGILGFLARVHGDQARAKEFIEDACQIYQKVGNTVKFYWFWACLLQMWPDASAVAQAEKGLQYFIDTKNKPDTRFTLHSLIYAEWSLGQFDRAKHFGEQVLELFPPGKPEDIKYNWIHLIWIGRLALTQGDLLSARLYFRMAASDYLQTQHKLLFNIFNFLDALAVFFSRRGDADRAARLFGAVEGAYQLFLFSLVPRQREEHDDALQAARQALSEEAFRSAWEAGRAMTHEQATRLAAAGLEEEPA